ncbi:SigE family RNA polymerase sigma factor [Actinomadura sp. DC4]|uniref:SigE family RNA polymerase sigma factor n=1 Tax=Actinomadura sp. DC4 TaxID=3055069 RepID=UPI0025B1CFEA|nr:SigE family RNA polymerase sigma factor [Actinomadura sp. DC4]MDN3357739.1 SigE family RNA polymerase sigma factor [Actinomadura sp. DC4]
MDTATEREFREFMVERSAALMRLAYLLSGGDQHAAEDLLQTALTKTVTRWASAKSPEAYVRQVMYRQQVDFWQRPWRRRETHVAVPPDEVHHDDAPASDLRITVREALTRITPRQRAVLALRFFEDLPEKEVARLLGCSVGTVRSTTHRSLARLRELAPELGDARRVKEVLQ